jgi:uncharacterized membrane protein YkvA (DUF1232 family)
MTNTKAPGSLIEKIKLRAKALKREAYALYLAAGDPRVPWYAKAFIPVLGYVDDLILVPLGIALAIKMIPPEVMTDSRGRVDELLKQGKPVIRGGAFIIIGVWLIVLGLVIWLVVRTIIDR